ncbi:MAG: hypothetical protein LBD42_07940 [Desulfovibrio sp.]|jgi:hypothetical protein|nr:hypothetical protein [Desulfovibrio sp.]
MSGSSQKTSGKLIALILAAAVAAAGVFFGISQWEKKQVQKIEEALRALPGSASSISVNFWNKSVVLTGMKAELPYFGLGTLSLHAGDFTVSGINFDALDAWEAVALADSLRGQNIRFTIDVTPESGLPSQTVSCASLSITGMKGDFNGVMAVLRDKDAQTFSRQTILQLIDKAKGLHMDSLVVDGYDAVANAGPISIQTTVESYRINDLRLLSCGVSTWKNAAMRLSGQNVLTVGTITVQHMSLPDLFTPFVVALPDKAWEKSGGAQLEDLEEADLKEPVLAMLKKLQEEPLLLREFSMRDLSIRSSPAVTLKNFFLDMELGKEQFSWKHSFDSLSIPRVFHQFAFSFLGDDLPLAYDDPLDLSGSLVVTGARKDGNIDIRISDAGLTEKVLGAIALEAELLTVNGQADASLEKLLTSPPELLLKKARATLVDEKAIDVYFSQLAQAVGEQPGDKAQETAKRLRAQAAEEFRQRGKTMRDVGVIMGGFADLLKQPGTLVIRLNPETPQSISAEDSDIDKMGISVEYTPRSVLPGVEMQ